MRRASRRGSLWLNQSVWSLGLFAGLALACEGDAGPTGLAGPAGTAGTPGDSCSVVDNGDGTYTVTCGSESVEVSDGNDGAGLASENCTTCHSDANQAAVGKVHLIKEYTHPAPDVVYTATITEAGILASAPNAGSVAITFQIKDNHGDFVPVGMYQDAGPLSAYDIRFYLAKLEPAGGAGIENNWYQVLYERGTDGNDFVDNGDGTYTFTSSVDITAGFTDATYSDMNATYEETATYRAGLAFGGHGGPASSPTYDFRPSDGETDPTVIDTRNIVSTATCVKCHGNEFSGHGGDRKTVENCVLCHNPTANMVGGDLANNLKDGESDSSDMAVMIHNIHNGTNDYWIYRSRAGGNWYNWGESPVPDDARATEAMTFPQPSYTCTVCHETDINTMSDGLNWKQKPSAVDCSDSCHTDLDIRDADTTHAGGQQVTDASCAGVSCHSEANIAAKHSTANPDIISADDLALDTPEFTIALTLLDSSGAEITSTTDIEGTAAQIKIVISSEGSAIDHTTIDTFAHANLFVYGPRSRANPVLTTAAAAGGLGYYASNDLVGDTASTITTGSIVYQLSEATGLTAGTYTAYVDICKAAGDATAGFQAPSVAKMNFQIGTTEVEKQVAGNCTACHGSTVMHGGIDSSHRHDTPFDAEGCAACHDYTNGNDTATSYEWFGGNPISKRVHAVHSAANLIDPDFTVGHAPPAGEDWAEIGFPAALNDCAGTCHRQDVSTDAYRNNANQLACMGCHDSPGASDHMLLMGGEPPPAE